MEKTICVFSSSSDAVAKDYFDAADEMGKQIVQNGYTLVYGGGAIGLMGAMARSVHRFGGKVIGVIPEKLNKPGIVYENADQLIVTRTMRERKALMEEHADAFAGMPGGFGTLEEILEIITLKQIQTHQKPIVLLDTCNFYQPLILLFEQIYRERFAKSIHRQLYHIAPTVPSAMEYLRSYIPPLLPEKWY